MKNLLLKFALLSIFMGSCYCEKLIEEDIRVISCEYNYIEYEVIRDTSVKGWMWNTYHWECSKGDTLFFETRFLNRY